MGPYAEDAVIGTVLRPVPAYSSGSPEQVRGSEMLPTTDRTDPTRRASDEASGSVAPTETGEVDGERVRLVGRVL